MRFKFREWKGVPIAQSTVKDMIRDLVQSTDEDDGVTYSWCGDTLVLYLRHEDMKPEILIAKVFRHGEESEEEPQTEWFDQLDV